MFPDFNIYSTPLLVLVIQGLILSLLLFIRYTKQRASSDLILAILVLVTCYHRTTYTIGFMAWYDTFRNTKINYFLISLILAVGPLIYYYIKSSVQRDFKLQRRDLLHFIPAFIYLVFNLGVYFYDRSQLGFNDTQNGILYLWIMDHLWEVFTIFFAIHLLIYLIFSFKLYYQFRRELNEEYSNTYKYELRWLRNFLYVYTFLFLYDSIQNLTEGLFIDLHWTEEWWYQFFSVLVVIYVGIKGYFTPVQSLKKIDLYKSDFESDKATKDVFPYKQDLDRLCTLVKEEQLFLDPNLTLSQLSRRSKINTSLLSFIINKGLNKNFNDFINEYRVEEVKRQLKDPEKSQYSILAIAFDCGFNSKATFNRVFKRIAGKAPSNFRK